MPGQDAVAADHSGDFLVRAIGRHKLLVVLVGVIGALAGTAIGLVRKPTYTASTTLQVGTVNPNSSNFYGFVQAASDLASVFSRSITAAPVLAQLRAKLGVSAADASQRLSAEPIPVSPSFRIIATGPTARGAIRLANGASHAVIAYNSHSLQRAKPQTARLLAEYHRAAQAVETAAVTVARLARAAGVVEAAAPGGSVPGSSAAGSTQGAVSAEGPAAAGSATSEQEAALIAARSNLAAARVRANALSAAYQSSLVSTGASPSTRLLAMVAGAVTASSDRTSKTELLAFVGLLAGLIAGAALAGLYELRARRYPTR